MSRVVDTAPILGDQKIGDVVRVDAGLVRVGTLHMGGARWCRLLHDDLTEVSGTRGVVWLAVRSRVLEVVRDQGFYAGQRKGEEIDPLRGRPR